jgi:hypothetical protein
MSLLETESSTICRTNVKFNKVTVGNWVFLRDPCWDVISKGRQLLSSSAQEAVKTEPERMKLKISTIRSRCQRTAGEDTAGWKRLSVCCGDMWIVKICGSAVIDRSSESCV